MMDEVEELHPTPKDTYQHVMPLESDEEPPKKSTKRNRTRMMHIWKQPSNERIVVKANRFRQPIQYAGTLLANLCGVVARNSEIYPLSYIDWRKMPTMTKKTAFAA